MTKGQGQALGSIFGTARRRASPPAAPVPVPEEAAMPAAVGAVLAVIDRVEGLVEAETEALARHLPADMTDFGNRKRQGLLELNRALKAAAAAGPRAEIRDRLARFAARLERNRLALGSQLLAVREIADIIAQTLQEAESDGTYSPPVGRS